MGARIEVEAVMRYRCKNGHDLLEHGKIVDTSRGMATRCTVCLKAKKERHQRRTCRNGHDLSVHGVMRESPSRGLHMSCEECRRGSRRREYQILREMRAARRASAPPKATCRNGHARSEYWRVPANGKGYCRKCTSERYRRGPVVYTRYLEGSVVMTTTPAASELGLWPPKSARYVSVTTVRAWCHDASEVRAAESLDEALDWMVTT